MLIGMQDWEKDEVTESIPMPILRTWYRKSEADEPLRFTDAQHVFGMDRNAEYVIGTNLHRNVEERGQTGDSHI
jgi:hypothetical protein